MRIDENSSIDKAFIGNVRCRENSGQVRGTRRGDQPWTVGVMCRHRVPSTDLPPSRQIRSICKAVASLAGTKETQNACA
jgi:hypothetical protein